MHAAAGIELCEDLFLGELVLDGPQTLRAKEMRGGETAVR